MVFGFDYFNCRDNGTDWERERESKGVWSLS